MKRSHKIDDVWAAMEKEKGDLIERSRAYSRWTVPSIMPEVSSDYTEVKKGSVLIGARVVNHLANRIIDVLFPISRPFFTVALTPEAQLELDKELDESQSAQAKEGVRDGTAKLERVAMRKLKLTEYRPVAILAAKHMIVTGNALLRRMPSGKRCLYSVDRYGVRRDIEGNEYEVVLHDKKILSTFDEKTQELIKEANDSLKPEDECTLLTHYKKEGKRWVVNQEADGMNLGNEFTLSEKDYDLLVLGWSLHPAEHYARGLVEDHAATFHHIDITTEATTDLMAIICDVKFLVKPASALAQDIGNLNSSPRGSYFPGNEGDITVPELGKRGDLQVMMQAIQKWEQDLSQAFLLSSVRDAERVTAEEIRMIASELESSFGGLYSQLAMSWQQKEAEFAISQVDIAKEVSAQMDIFEVLVTTGLESLSREGQVDNLRLAIGDLQMMEAVPEDIRGAMNPLRFAQFVFTNRSVDLKAFLNTQEEMQANQEAEMQQAGRMQGQQAEAAVAEHAGKAAVDNAQ